MEKEPTESELVKAVKEQYEKMLAEQKEQYEHKIEELKKDHTETIKTILTMGAKPQNDETQAPTEENEEETIEKNLRKKFKLD